MDADDWSFSEVTVRLFADPLTDDARWTAVGDSSLSVMSYWTRRVGGRMLRPEYRDGRVRLFDGERCVYDWPIASG